MFTDPDKEKDWIFHRIKEKKTLKFAKNERKKQRFLGVSKKYGEKRHSVNMHITCLVKCVCESKGKKETGDFLFVSIAVHRWDYFYP